MITSSRGLVDLLDTDVLKKTQVVAGFFEMRGHGVALITAPYVTPVFTHSDAQRSRSTAHVGETTWTSYKIHHKRGVTCNDTTYLKCFS